MNILFYKWGKKFIFDPEGYIFITGVGGFVYMLGSHKTISPRRKYDRFDVGSPNKRQPRLIDLPSVKKHLDVAI